MVNYNITWDPVQGSYGYTVEYRRDGTTTWVTPATPANPTLYTTYPLSVDSSYGYDIRVSSQGKECLGSYRFARINAAGCLCAAGYTVKADGTGCSKTETTSPTILSSDYCFAPSTLADNYGILGTKLFGPGYSTDLSNTDFTLLTTTPLWKDNAGTSAGPFNRRGVWIDADCNGAKDALAAGAVLQFTHLITLTSSRTVFIGVSGDNQFKVEVNGTLVAARTNPSDITNFRYYYLFPVNLKAGANYINFSGTGDGSVNDSIAAAIYDNTAVQLSNATSDSGLSLLFDSKDLICTTPPDCPKITIASCASGWFLDTSGGVGNYICKRILELGCGAPDPALTTSTTSTSTTTTSTTTAGV